MPVGLPISYYKYNKQFFFMFDKINLPLAKQKKSKFNLRNHVIATGEMGQLFPIRQIECVPGDEFNIDVEMFSRTAPLVVPTFGSVKFTTRAFFVPNRLCFPFWNEFITGKNVVINNQPTTPVIPYITNTEIVNFFITPAYGLTEASTEVVVDIEVIDDSEGYNPIFRGNFTNKGRYWLKVFNSLGYKFNFVAIPNNAEHDFNPHYSLLPLLSFLRIYLDYYLPSQYLENSLINQYFNNIRSTFPLHEQYVYNLWQVLDSIQLTYDNDYFTSAWRYPLSLLGNSSDQNKIVNDLSFNRRVESDNPANSYVRSNSYNGNSSIQGTNWAMTMAQKLANYIIRNNYAGSRAVEQILARFGVKVPDMEIQRSVHFGTSVSNLQIMDVTNTAESEDYKLGSYGAKAIGFDKGRKMHIECKEHGFILLLCSIMPETSQGFQGFDRNLLHLDKFDFYTPEFDKSIMQPIYSGELISNYKRDNTIYQEYKNNNAKPKNIFGFVPYATEYKIAHDNVIGDFNISHLNEGLDCYHLFREIEPDTQIIAQNPNLIYFNSAQYNRIFNVTNENQDHFYMIYRIKVVATRPMLSISESIPFNDDDIEHRNSVHMQANGSSMNN